MQKKNMLYTITILLIVLLSCSLFFLINNSYAAANNITDKTLCYKPILVEQGDSLWSIANENISPEWNSTEEYVSAIRKLNGITDSQIIAGTYISIPYYTVLENK